MIKLELKLNGKSRKVKLPDEILFNSLLSQNTKAIKHLIKIALPLCKISPVFFDIVNKYIDVTEDGHCLYGGLIVRTGLDEFAVLYLENTQPQDDYIIELVEQYLRSSGENLSLTVDINKIEIDKALFLRAMK